MWYDSRMNEHPLHEELKSAEAAIRHAKDVRAYHAKRTKRGSKQREQDLQSASDRLKSAMAPIRSYLGRAAYEMKTPLRSKHQVEAKRVSKKLQKERRSLWKMKDRNGHE